MRNAVVKAGVGAASAIFIAKLGFFDGTALARDRSEIELVKEKILSRNGIVPSRGEQELALSGSSLERPFDMLVIGGGATGAGVALDAASRGLRVGLVEREDFSAGTSSRSTKLLHGGVRYLEKAVFNLDYGQLKLVFHALEERERVIRNAPHICHPLPTMTPCYSWFELIYYWVGLKAYDLVAGPRILRLSRYYSIKEARDVFPTLSEESNGRKLRGGVVYYDGQMDDSRLNISLACTAALAGASVLNHAEVTSLHKDKKTGLVIGAQVRDKLTEKDIHIYAKVVVNAAGPFCDSVRQMADSSAANIICASSGAHVVLPDYYGPEGMGLIVPKTKDGRVVFMLPWQGKTLAGTTDSISKITYLPQPREEDIDFILQAISDYLNIEVRRSDILSAWSGIRPLATNPSAKDTASISRDHVVHVDSHGLVTITGGKWTTYRSMAEDATNAAIKQGKLNPSNGCVTDQLPVIGAYGWNLSFYAELAQSYGYTRRTSEGNMVAGTIDTITAKYLTSAYGSMAKHVAAITQEEHLGRKLAHGHPYLEAEVAYCARNEYCETAVDFIGRRTRLAFLDANAASEALPRVIEILAAEHGWSQERRIQEISEAEAYLQTFKTRRHEGPRCHEDEWHP
ncbi:glycerol-3-phosphate dehydrogenase SDP6, mitochondrial-like [Aristolochia californica]|uniref:glycerol-3-phosphate dehydrogenase SDP6, mitochondrial-like n=1 Tax=Aristolochia californica TaxID=171875 RepID=UPI0035E18C12